jgi:hypothetical protein
LSWLGRQQIVHHRRGAAGAIETAMVACGEIRLDPPGITVNVGEIYAD